MGTKDSLMGRLLGSAEKFTDKQIAETLTMLVTQGIKRGASDIHIEPHDRFVLVRYRIDGVLRGIHKLPRAALGTVLTQLKTTAGMNIQETQVPQEGSYSLDSGGKTIEIRLSTMPVFGGEKAVLHLAKEHGSPVDLSDLGFWGENLRALKSMLANPHGLIVVSGPRNSGVSSTLFSLLKDLNSPLVNIATVETSVKYRLPGINQTYLSGHISTQQSLQAALKQDPNIIMVDNLPNGTSSELAVHAATTGHMVLAGLHAENSIAALMQFHHSGVEPFLLITTLRASIGQRLVRKLCPHCRERYAPIKEERDIVEQAFGVTTASAHKRVHDLERSLAPTIFGDIKQLNSAPTQITHLWRASQSGCEVCDHTGYKGRTAIVEVLQNTDELHKAMLSKELSSATAIQAKVLKDGFIPLGLDGLVKALRGQTTIVEVLRAMAA